MRRLIRIGRVRGVNRRVAVRRRLRDDARSRSRRWRLGVESSDDLGVERLFKLRLDDAGLDVRPAAGAERLDDGDRSLRASPARRPGCSNTALNPMMIGPAKRPLRQANERIQKHRRSPGLLQLFVLTFSSSDRYRPPDQSVAGFLENATANLLTGQVLWRSA